MSASRSILLAFILTTGGISAAEFYVSPSGNDAHPGSKEQPFRTLERARDAVLAQRQAGRIVEETVVWIGLGDHVRTNSLMLNREHSGSEAGRIVWRGTEGTRLLGARRLHGFEPVNEADEAARLQPAARERVVQVRLDREGIVELGVQRSRGFGRETVPSHCELFYQGKPMTLARWPNEGSWEEIGGFPEVEAQPDGHGGKIGKLESGFNYRGERPAAWRETGDIWVHGYWAWDWANSYERVTLLDTNQRLVKTAAPYGHYGFRKGQRYYFLNVLEELDTPGEWYLDAKAARLYWWPPDDTWKQPDAEVLLSVLTQPFVELKDASHVSVEGLKLEGTRGTAIRIEGGTSNRIAGCVIQNVGNYGVLIRGGEGHGVVSCDVTDTGDGGVSLEGGDRRTLRPGGHLVENCHFRRQGRWSKCYVPAVLIGGVGHSARHNLIEEHPHCAVLFTGNDHRIEFNEIHHIALETGDVGAIYTGRDYTYRGNKIRHNFIHHTGGVGMGSMGVYMDDCVSGTEISGNIFYRVQRAAFLGGGRDHRVVNNVFVECNHAVELDGRGLDTSPVWRGMVNDTMRQRLREMPAALYWERYPEMKTLDAYYGPPSGPEIQGEAFKGVPPEGNVVTQNVCVGKWLNVYWHAKPDMLQVENNFTNAAAFFARAPGEQVRAVDFQLKSDATPLREGFQPIPADKIGLYQDRFRAVFP